MKKVILFTSSQISWSLIGVLIENKSLLAIVIRDNTHPQFHQMIQFIQQHGIKIYLEPDDEKEEFLDILRALNADIALSFSYPKIFSKKMTPIFRDGFFNIHPSPLPKYRGSSPLYWQIRNGETKSAISIHRVTEELDGGDIVYSVEFMIEKEATIGSLSNKVASIVPNIIIGFLEAIESNSIEHKEQKDFTYFQQPQTSDFQIDWQQDSAYEISQKAKASNPAYGGVETTISNRVIKILEATPIEYQTYGVKEGTIVLIDKIEGLVISTKDGAVRMDIISSFDGIFSGYSYSNYANLFSGEKFTNIKEQYV